MPAYFDVGFSVRQPAWHGLAEVLTEYPGREEAMRKAGHLWIVLEEEIGIHGIATDDDPESAFELIKGWKALTRSDTGAVLAVVKDSYKPIQNEKLWDIVDAIVAQPNVQYETAGVLRGGCTLWVMARLNEPWKVPGDNTIFLPYVAVGTAHDGTHATEALPMSVRVVCWNTYQAARAEARRNGTYFSFRHTENVLKRIEEAKEAMGVVRAQFDEFKEFALELARHPVREEGVLAFINRFIPEPELRGGMTQRANNFIRKSRDTLFAILHGETIPDAHRRTAYGLWCAGVEFLDHARAYRSNETYFRRVTEPSALKHQLAKLALEVAS